MSCAQFSFGAKYGVLNDSMFIIYYWLNAAIFVEYFGQSIPIFVTNTVDTFNLTKSQERRIKHHFCYTVNESYKERDDFVIHCTCSECKYFPMRVVVLYAHVANAYIFQWAPLFYK